MAFTHDGACLFYDRVDAHVTAPPPRHLAGDPLPAKGAFAITGRVGGERVGFDHHRESTNIATRNHFRPHSGEYLLADLD